MKTDRNAVLDPTQSRYVLPSPPARGGVLVIGEEHSLIPVLRRGGIVARALGHRFQIQAESLQLFLTEARERLARLDSAIAEDSRAQLKGAVRELVGLMDWCDAVQGELAIESGRAIAGEEPIDVGALCQQVASQCQQPAAPVTVLAEQEVTWWGDCAALADAIEQALALVAERTQDVGMRCLEVTMRYGAASVLVHGRGEPSSTIDPSTVSRFRAAADRIGATVLPGSLGPGGASLILSLPS